MFPRWTGVLLAATAPLISLFGLYVRTTWLPADDRCLCLFEAATRDEVRQVNDTAQVPFAAILPAVDLQAAAPPAGRRTAASDTHAAVGLPASQASAEPPTRDRPAS